MNEINFDLIAEQFNNIVKQQAAENELYYLNFKRHFLPNSRKYSIEVVFSFRYKWLEPEGLMKIVNEVLKKQDHAHEKNAFVDFIEFMEQEIHFQFGFETLEIRIPIYNLDETLQAQFNKAIISSLLLARTFYKAVLIDREKSLNKRVISFTEQDIIDVIKTIKPISDSVLANFIFEAIKKFFGL